MIKTLKTNSAYYMASIITYGVLIIICGVLFGIGLNDTILGYLTVYLTIGYILVTLGGMRIASRCKRIWIDTLLLIFNLPVLILTYILTDLMIRMGETMND